MRLVAAPGAPASPTDTSAFRQPKDETEWRAWGTDLFKTQYPPTVKLFTAQKVDDPEGKAQDTILEATQYLWKPHDPAQIPALVATIAWHKIFNARRSKRRNPQEHLDETLAERQLTQDEKLALARDLRALRQAFQDLREDKRKLLEELELECRSADEMAQELGVNKGTLWTRASRFRKELVEAFFRRRGEDPEE